MRFLLSFIYVLVGLTTFAQAPDVTYLESLGNNGATKVFAVATPTKSLEIQSFDDKGKLTPEEQACRAVLYALLFDGVDNYNDGRPLVTNTNDAFAKSLVNPKNKTFMAYFKDIQLENSPKNDKVRHFIVELNHFNLLRLLRMRGSIQ